MAGPSTTLESSGNRRPAAVDRHRAVNPRRADTAKYERQLQGDLSVHRAWTHECENVIGRNISAGSPMSLPGRLVSTVVSTTLTVFIFFATENTVVSTRLFYTAKP